MVLFHYAWGHLGSTCQLTQFRQQVESEVRKLSSGYGAHALICTAASEAAYTQAPKLLRNLGVLVCVGLGTDFNLPISPFEMAVRGTLHNAKCLSGNSSLNSPRRLYPEYSYSFLTGI